MYHKIRQQIFYQQSNSNGVVLNLYSQVEEESPLGMDLQERPIELELHLYLQEKVGKIQNFLLMHIFVSAFPTAQPLIISTFDT